MERKPPGAIPGVVVGYQSFMPDEDPLASLGFASRHGLGLVEFNANMPWFFPERFDADLRASLRESAREKGIALALHAPEEISLVTPHPSLLEAGIRRMQDFIILAGDLGACALTFHLGGNYLRWSMGDTRVLFPHQLYADVMKRSMAAAIPRLAESAEERGVALSLENAGTFGREVIQDTVAQLLASCPLRLTWDLGHSNTRSGREEEQERFFLEHMDRIALFHLHDNDGITDSHSPLGTGTVDLRRSVELARMARAPLSIEVRPRDLIPRSLAALREAVLGAR